MGKSRAKEHEAFLRWLVQIAEEQKVQAIIVAGDVFDTATPPSYAREMYNRFVVELNRIQVDLIILAGNHDSVAVLDESKSLLNCLNARVFSTLDSQEVVTLTDAEGNASALLCPIPFIRPRDVMLSKSGQEMLEKQSELQQGISEHYQRMYQKAEDKRKAIGEALPIIMTGHLTTVGAMTSDSVRDIYIGTLDAFPAAAFPPADYIALGHIHRSQKVAGTEHIRYSGSPIPLSFDETNRQKHVLLVEFLDGALHQVSPLDVPLFQCLQTVRGSLTSLPQAVKLACESFRPIEEVSSTLWLAIEVESDDYISDLQTPIQEMTAELPVEVLWIKRVRDVKQQPMQMQENETLAELSVLEVFERRLAQEAIDEDVEKELIELYQQVSTQVEESL
ncbi:exonuclease subunit SbcD [Pleionea sp. CnH1-48]|nr:exonuclease subunit SbcD [Pleionea sp. CnH1-48]